MSATWPDLDEGRPHLFAGDQTFVLINWYPDDIERRLTGDGSMLGMIGQATQGL